MNPYVLNLEIEITDSLNVVLRTHRMKRWTVNKEIYNQIHLLTLGRRPERPLEKAKLMFIRYAWRELDYDNLVASLKPLADGLTKAGIIKNDSFQTTGRWIVDQTKISKKDMSKIFIRVESV